MRSYPVKEKLIGSSFTEILWYKQVHRHTHILLHLHLYRNEPGGFEGDFWYFLPPGVVVSLDQVELGPEHLLSSHVAVPGSNLPTALLPRKNYSWAQQGSQGTSQWMIN